MTEVDLNRWFREYGAAIHRRCARLLGESSEAQDVTQEVFLRAHRYAHTFDGRASPFTWLVTIADRQCFDVLRKRRPAADPTDAEAFLSVESGAAKVLDADFLRRLLGRLDEVDQQIVAHRYLDELDLQAIAQRLGVNERTVRRRLERIIGRAEKLAGQGRVS